MDASSLLRDQPGPGGVPPLAIVSGERIHFANAQLADLTGYTVNELTSPEFRFSYLFTAEAPLLLGFAAGETRRSRAKIVPLRGEPARVMVNVHLVSSMPQESFLVVFERGDAAAGEPGGPARAALSLAQGLRSSLAREAAALRRLQERAAALEGAPAPRLAESLAQLALMHEEAARLEGARVKLERHVAALAAVVAR